MNDEVFPVTDAARPENDGYYRLVDGELVRATGWSAPLLEYVIPAPPEAEST